jgi:hypothetical protein
MEQVFLEKLIVIQLVKKIPAIFCNPKVHYCVHNSPPTVPIMSQKHPIHTFHPLSLRFILILSSHLCLGLPHSHLSSGFSTKILYPLLTSTMCAICTIHLILLDFFTLIIFGEGCKLWRSPLCSLLQIFSSEPCSQTPSIHDLPLVYEAKLHAHTKQVKLQFSIF